MKPLNKPKPTRGTSSYRFRVDRNWRGRYRWWCTGIGIGVFTEGNPRSRYRYATEAEALSAAEAWAEARYAATGPTEWEHTPGAS